MSFKILIAILLGGFGILVLLFWGLGALTESAFPAGNGGIDESLTRSANETAASNATWRSALRTVTELGGGAVTVPLAVVAGLIWLWKRRNWEGPLLLTLSMGGATAARLLVKWLVARPRPAVAQLVEATGSAFPSGHTMQAVVLYGALAVLASRILRSRKATLSVWLAALTLIVTVGSSRVILGVHYVSDVVAGLAFGAAWLLVAVRSTLSLGRPPRQATAS